MKSCFEAQNPIMLLNGPGRRGKASHMTCFCRPHPQPKAMIDGFSRSYENHPATYQIQIFHMLILPVTTSNRHAHRPPPHKKPRKTVAPGTPRRTPGTPRQPQHRGGQNWSRGAVPLVPPNASSEFFTKRLKVLERSSLSLTNAMFFQLPMKTLIPGTLLCLFPSASGADGPGSMAHMTKTRFLELRNRYDLPKCSAPLSIKEKFIQCKSKSLSLTLSLGHVGPSGFFVLTASCASAPRCTCLCPALLRVRLSRKANGPGTAA